jgi:hypothetical protein
MTDRQRSRLPRRFSLVLGGRLFATTTDVCAEGFAAELGPVFVPGSRVEGRIQLGFCEVPFEGEVTWARAGRPELELASQVGVRFDQPIPEIELAIGKRPKPQRVAFAIGG